MPDSKKLTIALTQLEVMRRNIPDDVPEERVNEYHAIVADLESSLEEDLSAFRIPQNDVTPTPISFRPAPYSRRRPATVRYSTTKYCDRDIFLRKIEGLTLYIQKRRPQPEANPKDYWSMSDTQLDELATKYNIPPASISPDGQWYIDRDRIIDQLLKRDRTMNPKPPSNKIEIGNMIGSSIQQGSPNSVSTVNYEVAAPEIKQFVAEIKSAIDKLAISDAAREELKTDIQTLDVQIDSKNPKTAIILESLSSVRNILEGAVGSVVAAGLLQHFPKIMELFR
jgi:hypothetical protein